MIDGECRVVERCSTPAIRVVALIALLSERPSVLVVLGVTPNALPRRARRRRKGTGDMAFLARKAGMLTRQLERQAVVVEVRGVSAFTVVAQQALLAERRDVARHETRVETRVALFARGDIEARQIVRMAVLAGHGGQL
jgi:hypothetical protein